MDEECRVCGELTDEECDYCGLDQICDGCQHECPGCEEDDEEGEEE